MVFSIISAVLLLPYLALILFYRRSWLKIRDSSITADHQPAARVMISVVIPARNEEKNIGFCLESVMAQNYPKEYFEVLVVDDHSSDATAAVASSFGEDRIRVLSLQDYSGEAPMNSYKKMAIEIAIGQARGSLMVTTDADCVAGPRWLETIASFYESSAPVFIAAPVVFSKGTSKEGIFSRLFKIFQSLDFIGLQEITGASVDRKFHYMCNGANLAYEKKVFYEVGGFKGIDEIASGDDMLLLHKIQKRYPDRIGFLKSRDAIVETAPAEGFLEFLHQRIRWASKADRYTDKTITGVLLLVYLLNVWLLILAVSAFFISGVGYLLVGVLLAKSVAECFFLWPGARFFHRVTLLWWLLPLQPFHVIYTVVAGWLGKFGKYQWKGRAVR